MLVGTLAKALHEIVCIVFRSEVFFEESPSALHTFVHIVLNLDKKWLKNWKKRLPDLLYEILSVIFLFGWWVWIG